MKRKLLSITLVLGLSTLTLSPTFAAIDLQADLNRIMAAIKQFGDNSAKSSSVKTMTDVRKIFSNNAVILREIRDANIVFKRNLNSAKRQIPSSDTKDSPAFSTLMNLTKGYEEWLKYQNINQARAQKCIDKAGSSFSAFLSCSIADLPKSMENETIGRQKIQAAWNAWRKWQVKYGYA